MASRASTSIALDDSRCFAKRDYNKKKSIKLQKGKEKF